MVAGVIDDCAASAALLRTGHGPAARSLIGGDGDGGGGVDGRRLRLEMIGLQHGQRVGQVARVHVLVRRVFRAHHPSVRGAGRRGDEEQFVQLRRLEETLRAVQFVLAHDGRGLAEVDPRPHVPVQEARALERFADGDRVGVRVEGADDAA